MTKLTRQILILVIFSGYYLASMLSLFMDQKQPDIPALVSVNRRHH